MLVGAAAIKSLSIEIIAVAAPERIELPTNGYESVALSN
jgi:hypothetical protein